jgi:hypothetical protein
MKRIVEGALLRDEAESILTGEDVFAVGASLLAMDVNDNACFLSKGVALESIASKLAPTGKV